MHTPDLLIFILLPQKLKSFIIAEKLIPILPKKIIKIKHYYYHLLRLLFL